MDQDMRNAPVAALLYEMLFDIYRDMAGTRAHNQWFPDENGTMREAFYHYHSTYWEWSTEMLLAVGAIKAIVDPSIVERDGEDSAWRHSPYSYPVMTLDEFRAADFSDFESFDNYCFAMFIFDIDDGTIDPRYRSPHFLEDIASKDDIFLIISDEQVKADRNRYKEKVMRRWEEMDVRTFRQNSEEL